MNKDHRNFFRVIGLQHQESCRSSHMLATYHIHKPNPGLIDSAIRRLGSGIITQGCNVFCPQRSRRPLFDRTVGDVRCSADQSQELQLRLRVFPLAAPIEQAVYRQPNYGERQRLCLPGRCELHSHAYLFCRPALL